MYCHKCRKEIPDNISVMSGVSEADSIVRAFKKDVKSNNFTGEKLKANLSENFLYNLEEWLYKKRNYLIWLFN